MFSFFFYIDFYMCKVGSGSILVVGIGQEVSGRQADTQGYRSAVAARVTAKSSAAGQQAAAVCRIVVNAVGAAANGGVVVMILKWRSVVSPLPGQTGQQLAAVTALHAAAFVKRAQRG